MCLLLPATVAAVSFCRICVFLAAGVVEAEAEAVVAAPRST